MATDISFKEAEQVCSCSFVSTIISLLVFPPFQAKTLLSDPEALAALMATTTAAVSTDKKDDAPAETKKEESEEEESDEDMGMG